MATKKIMVVPCMVNMRLKTCGETKLLCEMHQLDANDERFDSADHEKQQSVENVENAEPLVIDRGHPLVKRRRPMACSSICTPGIVIAFDDIVGLQLPLAKRLHITHDRIQIRVAQFHGRHQRAGFDRVWVLNPEAKIFGRILGCTGSDRGAAHQVRQIRAEASVGRRSATA